jgi:type I restriction enzyme S subunit
MRLRVSDLDGIYNALFNATGGSADGHRPVVALIDEEATKCLSAPDGINFANKVVLAIGTRLAAERFMVDKINDSAFVAAIETNQTTQLLAKYQELFPAERAALDALQRVALMTPENIHLNSFMYEPILDMSDNYLRTLYKEVTSLQAGKLREPMIADLKPYAEYEATAHGWLGEVPGHWSVLPNRALFFEVKDRDHPDEVMLSVTITRGIVEQKTLLEGGVKKDSSNLDKSAYKLVRPHDIAYNKMRAWQGAIGVSALRGIISPAYVVVRLRNSDDIPRYFHHLYRTPQFAKEAERWSYGITSDMWSLRPEHFKMIYTPVPPPVEQAAIARFLDGTNGRIERAVRAKRKVIALLNEQKQAIAHCAVTRGLDPSVSLKPSGVPWLGDIPQHWEVRRLKFVASRIVDCLHETPRYSNSGSYPAIRTADIAPGVVRLGRAKRISTADYVRWTARLEPSEGDILYSREGERFGIAACVPPGVKLCISQRMMVFRIGDSDCAEFVMMLLNSRSTYSQALQDVMGATAPHVNISTIKNYSLALPKKQEQKAIVRYIRSKSAPIDIAISRLEREVELLREYRTRLVADVVTGKIDVREAAARLPHEASLEITEDGVELIDESEDAEEEGAE